MTGKRKKSAKPGAHLTVACPGWLRRSMVKNLLTTAVNSKVNSNRAERALDILAAAR